MWKILFLCSLWQLRRSGSRLQGTAEPAPSTAQNPTGRLPAEPSSGVSSRRPRVTTRGGDSVSSQGSGSHTRLPGCPWHHLIHLSSKTEPGEERGKLQYQECLLPSLPQIHFPSDPLPTAAQIRSVRGRELLLNLDGEDLTLV